MLNIVKKAGAFILFYLPFASNLQPTIFLRSSNLWREFHLKNWRSFGGYTSPTGIFRDMKGKDNECTSPLMKNKITPNVY